MKRMLAGLVVLALLMVTECPAGGNKGTNFHVVGTFDSGDIITGYPAGPGVITIDTVHGSVLYADLWVYNPTPNSLDGGYVAHFGNNASGSAPIVSTNAAGDVEITVYGYDGDWAWIVLTLPVKSLKKYAGGDVIASDSYWEDSSNFTDYLANGVIEPTSP
jgi:hypothetical protein